MRAVYDSDDFDAILEDHSLVLVDFNATWCGPCKRIKPKLEVLSSVYTDIFFCAVDVDQCEELAKRYNISCMPTFHFFKNGKLVEGLTVEGANEQSVTESLEKLRN